jgi:hypothetical protein
VADPAIEPEILTADLLDTLQRATISSREVAPLAKPGGCVVCGDPVSVGTMCPTHASLDLEHERMKQRALGILKGNVEKYATLHMEASERAALRGEGRPMEWALTHTRVVEPVAPPKEAASKGTKVTVGVLLPGCGPAMIGVTVEEDGDA